MNQEIWFLFCHKTLDTGYVCQVNFHEIFSGSVMNGNKVGSTGGIISSTPGKRSANDFAGCAEKARKHGSAKKSRSTRDDNCLAIHDNFVNENLI